MHSSDFNSLVELLRFRAGSPDDRLSYTFLEGGERESEPLGATELDRRARVIAGHLQSRLALEGGAAARVLLAYPPGLDYIAAFFGCMYAGVTAVTAYPPRSLHRKEQRLPAIVRDAGARCVLTTAALLTTARSMFSDSDDLSELLFLATDTVLDETETVAWEPVDRGREDLALLQYTSGSTGSPKGVMVTHGNLLAELENLDQLGWDHTPESVMVSWLPIFHDMGLVYGMLQPLWGGFACYLMAPQDFIKRPMRWLEAIDRYRGTHTAAPNFAFDLCVRKSSPEQRTRLDLRSWRVALNGSEPVRPGTVEQFAAAFAPSGFDPCTMCPAYGLAEATLKVVTKHRDQPVGLIDLVADDLERGVVREAGGREVRVHRITSNGVASLDTRVLIVDPESRAPRGENEVGEIWVQGSIVSPGYWRRPEETARTVQAGLADGEGEGDEGSFLRTGDLGFLRHGELYITGRLKDVIIIRGRNHYPQDIEHTVGECHPALRPGCTAAYPVEVDGEERLGLGQEVRPAWEERFDSAAVIETIALAVAEEHELEVATVSFLRAGEIPKTSSGKIMRRACRQRVLDDQRAGRDDFLPGRPLPEPSKIVPEDQELPDLETLRDSPPELQREVLTAHLRKRVAEVSGVAPSKIDRIDRRQPLSSLGFDSVNTMQLIAAIERDLRVKLPPDILFSNPSLSRLVEELLARSPMSSTSRSSAAVHGSSLIPIQLEGSKPPFFCVHPLGGVLFPYYELARHLGPDQPFYGLQAAGLHADSDRTVEEMSARYVELLRTIQESGPYLLGGWSFGAFVAYEMARQLRSQGEEVALLANFDMPVLSRTRARPFMILNFLLAHTLVGWPIFHDYLRIVSGGGEGRFSFPQLLAAVARELWSLKAHGAPLRRIFRVMRINTSALIRYDLPAYTGSMVLFRTGKSLTFAKNNPSLGWNELAPGGVDVRSVPGHHMSFLSPPHVEEVARQLAASMDQAAGATRPGSTQLTRTAAVNLPE